MFQTTNQSNIMTYPRLFMNDIWVTKCHKPVAIQVMHIHVQPANKVSFDITDQSLRIGR